MLSNPHMKANLPKITLADQINEMESRNKLRPSQSCGIPQEYIYENGPEEDPILSSNFECQSAEYDSDDSNRLNKGLSRLSSGDRAKILDK